MSGREQGSEASMEDTAFAWDSIPVLAQRQDSLVDQLNDLARVALRLGMYDASDWIAWNRRDMERS